MLVGKQSAGSPALTSVWPEAGWWGCSSSLGAEGPMSWQLDLMALMR
jgi:hypothetical protein